MAKVRGYGLKSILVGDIESDGSMATVLTEIFGDTVPGSATLESTEPTREDILTEEDDAPIDTIVTEPGRFEVRFGSYNLSPHVLALLFGGTVTGDDTWNAPDQMPVVEKSIKVETLSGIIVQMPRCKIVGQIAWSFDKSRYGQVNIIGSVLQPTKSGLAKIKMLGIESDPGEEEPGGEEQLFPLDFPISLG